MMSASVRFSTFRTKAPVPDAGLATTATLDAGWEVVVAAAALPVATIGASVAEGMGCGTATAAAVAAPEPPMARAYAAAAAAATFDTAGNMRGATAAITFGS